MGDFGSINLDSKKPYYLQLKELIQGKIECRELLPNQKLPSEAELCKELKVSRTVIRQALVELEQEGLIRKRKGIGSFVAENKSKLMISLYPLDHLFLVESEEQITKLQLLKKTSLPAPAHTASTLMINDGDLVLQVLRLYCQREEPVILSRSLLPAHVSACLNDEDLRKPVRYAENMPPAACFDHAENFIEITEVSGEDAELLRIPPGAPVFKVSTLSFNKEHVPIEADTSLLRGDRVHLQGRIFLD